MKAHRPYSANELLVGCIGRDNNVEEHRIWIKSDGRVLTPDHVDGYDHEAVVGALGGDVYNGCKHWRQHTFWTVGDGQERPRPKVDTWRYVYADFWTAAAMETANCASLGYRETRPIPPVEALLILQAFSNDVKLTQTRLGDMLFLLNQPWSRPAGARRNTPADHHLVAAYLHAGLPADLVPDLVALEVPPGLASELVRRFQQFRLPETTLTLAATVFQVPELRLLADSLTEDVARTISSDLRAAQHADDKPSLEVLLGVSKEAKDRNPMQ